MLQKNYLKSRAICKVTFTLPLEAAPGAESVVLIGDFNDWGRQMPAIEMTKNLNGYQATVELEPGRSYEFRYLIDGSRWENDWSADDYVPSPYEGIENSVIWLDPLDIPVKPVPRNGKDDLTRIEGIGPKIAGLLNAADIHTFAELAATSAEQLKVLLEGAEPHFRIHDPTTWPGQAALARDGQWEELKGMQEKLKGGRKRKK